MSECAGVERVEVKSVFVVWVSLTAFGSQSGGVRLIYGEEKNGSAVAAVQVWGNMGINA